MSTRGSRSRNAAQHESAPPIRRAPSSSFSSNVLVHRDYDVHEPARIDIMPGAEIAFSNPGGLMQKVARRVTLGDDGALRSPKASPTHAIPPSATSSSHERYGARGHRAYRRRPTHDGVAGGAAFTITAAKGALRRGSRSPGPRPVRRRWHARRRRGIYVLNTLPFSVVPDTISIVQLTKPWEDLPRDIDFSECGTFMVRGSELWSFVPLPVFSGLIGPVMDKEASVTVAREHVRPP